MASRYSYSFIFSSRPGTTASKIGEIDPAIAKKRLKIFQKISEKIKNSYREGLVNKELEVLFENKMSNQEKYFGRDEYGDSVIVESKTNLTGKKLNIKIKNFNQGSLFGEIIFDKKNEGVAA